MSAALEVELGPSLTEEQAREIFSQGEEAVVFALLELTQQLAEARSPSVTPSTPSGMVPVYEKPAKKGKRVWAPANYHHYRQPLQIAEVLLFTASDGITAMPEPGSAVMLILALVLLGTARRRR